MLTNIRERPFHYAEIERLGLVGDPPELSSGSVTSKLGSPRRELTGGALFLRIIAAYAEGFKLSLHPDVFNNGPSPCHVLHLYMIFGTISIFPTTPTTLAVRGLRPHQSHVLFLPPLVERVITERHLHWTLCSKKAVSLEYS